jgi:hypothetical protein
MKYLYLIPLLPLLGFLFNFVVGVRVLDHIVIGHDRYFSFSDKGLL